MYDHLHSDIGNCHAIKSHQTGQRGVEESKRGKGMIENKKETERMRERERGSRGHEGRGVEWCKFMFNFAADAEATA